MTHRQQGCRAASLLSRGFLLFTTARSDAQRAHDTKDGIGSPVNGLLDGTSVIVEAHPEYHGGRPKEAHAMWDHERSMVVRVHRPGPKGIGRSPAGRIRAERLVRHGRAETYYVKDSSGMAHRRRTPQFCLEGSHSVLDAFGDPTTAA